MNNCPKCNYEYQTGEKSCPKCGIIFEKYIALQEKQLSKRQSLMTECKVCGKEISKNAANCPRCGEPNKIEKIMDSSKVNHKLSPKEMTRCVKCGASFDKAKKKCPECNHSNNKSRAQILTGLIAILGILWIIAVGSSSMLYIWLISWVIFGLLISIKTKSIVSITGGSFIASLIVIIIFASLTGQMKTKNDSKNQPSKEQAAIDKKARAAEAKREREQEYEKCKLDLQCWGDKHSLRAIYACQDLIERHAKYSFKWTDGVLGPKFSRFRWKNKEQLTLTYFGDKIQFQNGFGAWQNMIYQCDYDPINEKVISVKVEPGRL